MTIFLILAVCALVIAAGTGLRVGRQRMIDAAKRRERAALAAKRREFSWPAQQILNDWDRLPAQHRPGHDIEAALRALDTKYDKEAVDHHFIVKYDYSYGDFTRQPSWNCSCVYDPTYRDQHLSDTCNLFPKYEEVHNSIKGIQQALTDQENAQIAREHALVLAGMENDLRSLDAITEALRAERDLINDVTKEISA